MDSGSHKNDGVESLKVLPSPQHVPKVPQPTWSSNDGDTTSQLDTSELSSEESDSTDDSECILPEAIYDKADGVYRCENIGCGWEIAFGYCHGCQTKYVIEVRPEPLIDISLVNCPCSRPV